tara:strand:- start:4200 stop:4538 length:339 start_codon:yes stop_codon:yes gene_type:complete
MTALEYDNLPQEIKRIVDTYNDNENLYEECSRIKTELEQMGWTCDYDLSGEVFDVRRNPRSTPIKKQIKFFLPNGRTWYLIREFNNESHVDAFIDKMKRERGYVMDEIWEVK